MPQDAEMLARALALIARPITEVPPEVTDEAAFWRGVAKARGFIAAAALRGIPPGPE